jgi:HAE1 family hydrophobic/amphiphilic exporter-1
MDRNDIEADIRDNFPLPAGIICRPSPRNTGAGRIRRDQHVDAPYGEDTGTLLDLAEEAVRRLRTIPGLLSVDTDSERGGQELRRCTSTATAPAASASIRAGFQRHQQHHARPRSRPLARPDGRELRIFAQLGEADRTGLDDVRSMTFLTDTGIDVPLESIADLRVGRTLGQIRREAARPSLRSPPRPPRRIRAASSNRDRQSHGRFRNAARLPLGQRQRIPRTAEQEKDEVRRLTLAITFVFLLMGLLFESFVLPLAVIIAVPIRLPRRVWTLYLTETPPRYDGPHRHRDPRRCRREQRHRARRHGQPAARRGHGALRSPDRSRPSPFPPDHDDHDDDRVRPHPDGARHLERSSACSYAPLGRTMIGGLLAATLLTLVIVPLFYALLDDLREFVGRVWSSIFARPATPPPTVSGAAAGVGRANRVE